MWCHRPGPNVFSNVFGFTLIFEAKYKKDIPNHFLKYLNVYILKLVKVGKICINHFQKLIHFSAQILIR